jgi:hypothetical protein
MTCVLPPRLAERTTFGKLDEEREGKEEMGRN